MTGNNHTQKFFQYLQGLQYYTIIKLILHKLLIAIVLLNILSPQISFAVLICIFLFTQYKFSFVDLAKDFDRRYDCNDLILSTYYLTKESQKTTFYPVIVSQATVKLQQYLPQEKRRIHKIYMQQSFMIAIAIICLGITFASSGQKSLQTNEKKILRISAKKMQKIAKNIEMLNEKDAKFLKDIAETWQRMDIEKKDIAKSLQQLNDKIQKIRDRYKEIQAQQTATEQQIKNLLPQNQKSVLEKIAQSLPSDIYEEIRKHIEDKKWEKALQVYKSYKTKLPNKALQEATNLTNKLHKHLLKTTQIKATANTTDPFEVKMSQKKFHFSKATTVHINKGWETITYPGKYHNVVHSYLEERNNNEKK
ncbi:hypothetical protein [Candidatus Uabimicrobium amorphum]|uniref:Uncharacterized protein n=1 Tax=Uabimicrobium amorphum TaxID=2596890 RepID=A0A5S9F466_UABAM|nr:hypothetical protein [Candidatus Uabimicrobium amorphum]BBM84843.1 hypothetical protein UABAM_03204 [Candidatus Uabimicrobium amorphum]